MKLWIGKEKEGIYKGIITLFIPSPKIKYINISNILEKNKKIRQIYFGAGQCSKINQYVVEECMKKNHDMLITLEVSLDDLCLIDKRILKFCNIIVTITNDNFSFINYRYKHNYQIKLQSLKYKKKVLMMQELNKVEFVDVSKLQYKRYKGDKLIEI